MLHHLATRQKLIVMLAVMSALFLTALDQTIISTALGAIVKEFNSYSSLGFIVTAYMLTTTVTTPLAGKLSDMYGRKVLLLSGVAIFTVGSLLSGSAPSIEWLIGWRALQGIGGGVIMANAFTIIGDLFTPRERGKWQGLIGAVFGMSSAVGPLLGGWLTDGITLFGAVSDWRWTFFINVPIGIISLATLARYCPQIKHDKIHRPDYLGAVYISVALAAIVLAVDNTETVFSGLITSGINEAIIKLALWFIALIAAAAFVWTERRAAQPILPLRFFANRNYTLMMIAALLSGAAFLGVILYLTQFNQQVFGATASSAGLMLLPMVSGMMIASISTGQLVSRYGRYKCFIIAGFSIAALGILSLITLQPDSPYWHEAVTMFFTGLGMGMAMPILNLAVQNEFAQKDLGAATSSVQLFRGLGSTIGAAVLSGVLTIGILSALGNPVQIPYIQTLKQSPAASQMLSGEITPDTLLRVNMQQAAITAGAQQGFSHLQKPVADHAFWQFKSQQQEFATAIINAFTASLHRVFMISAALMMIGLVVVMFVRERPLRRA